MGRLHDQEVLIIHSTETPTQHEVRTYERVTATWLTRKPDPRGYFIAALWVLLSSLVSITYWLLGQNESYSTFRPTAERGAIFEDLDIHRLLTALFAHGDLGHLVANSLLMILLGSFFFAFFGQWRAFLASLFFGALTNLVTLVNMKPGVQLLGASGVVFWIGAAWLTLYLLIDTKRTRRQRFLRSTGVALLLFMPTQAFDPSISYTAHGVGFLLGLCWGLIYYFLHRREILHAEVRELVVETA